LEHLGYKTIQKSLSNLIGNRAKYLLLYSTR
jgi:hypothetical protein